MGRDSTMPGRSAEAAFPQESSPPYDGRPQGQARVSGLLTRSWRFPGLRRVSTRPRAPVGGTHGTEHSLARGNGSEEDLQDEFLPSGRKTDLVGAPWRPWRDPGNPSLSPPDPAPTRPPRASRDKLATICNLWVFVREKLDLQVPVAWID